MSFFLTINRINQWLGKICAWLLLAMMLLTVLLVLLRYVFSIGSIALQELITVCHASVFLLGLSYTLSLDEHVRVDIFYQRFNQRQRDWINAIGCMLLLLPFTTFLLIQATDFFYNSFLMRESSAEPDGLPYLFLFKALLPVSFFMLFLQGLAMFLDSAYRLIFTDSEAA